jgi:RND family efflux transporter MFP subunit
MKFTSVLKVLLVPVALTGAYFGLREWAVPEVELVPVKRGVATLSATGNVTVLSAADGKISAPEKGLLRKFGRKVGDKFENFKEGDTVNERQIVGEIDAGPLPYSLQQYEADLARLRERKRIGSPLKYELQRREKDLENSKILYSTKDLPLKNVRDLETEVDSLKFKIQMEQTELDYSISRMEIQVAQIKDQLERYTLRAPWRGLIMAPAFMEGDLVFAGNVVAKVTSTDKLIKVEVNQDDLPAVRKSKRVVINFFSFPGVDYEGKVSMLVEIGNSSTQRFTVFVKPVTLPKELLIGQTGEASFIADVRPNALLIPASALMGSTSSGDGFVFLFDSVTKVLEKRRIKVGYSSISTVEVLEGLKDGDLVVHRDVDLQHDGTRVRPK